MARYWAIMGVCLSALSPGLESLSFSDGFNNLRCPGSVVRQRLWARGAALWVCFQCELNYKFIRLRGWKLRIFHRTAIEAGVILLAMCLIDFLASLYLLSPPAIA